VPTLDPNEVRRLVAEAVARALGETPAPAPAAKAPIPKPAPPRTARILDWSKPTPGDVKPVATPAPRAPGRPADAPKPRADPAKTVAIGGDHGGYALKESLRKFLSGELGWAVIDVGTHSTEPVDYPDIARAVGEAVADGRAARGIVIDGAGIGSAIAANKIDGIRAVMGSSETIARYSREHNGANVLTLGATLLSTDAALAIVDTWLQTPMTEPRYIRRLAKIHRLETGGAAK